MRVASGNKKRAAKIRTGRKRCNSQWACRRKNQTSLFGGDMLLTVIAKSTGWKKGVIMDAAQQKHAKILHTTFPQNLIYPSRILRHWVTFKTTTSLQSSIKHSALPHEASKNTDWYFYKNDFDDNIVIPRRHPLCLKETNIQLMTPLWRTEKKTLSYS